MAKIHNEKLLEAKDQFHVLIQTLKDSGYNNRQMESILNKLAITYNELDEFEKETKNNLIGFLTKEKVIQ